MKRLGVAALLFSIVGFGCSSSSPTPSSPADGGGSANDAAGPAPADAAVDAPWVPGSTTIAQARGGNVTTPITVTAVVTGVRGDDPKDTKEWYIEDPQGGPNSGIAVYCDKAAQKNPCPMSVPVPNLHDLVTVTGSITSYQGKLEIAPTALVVVNANAPLPPVPTVQAADLSPGGTSNLRGTLVKLTTKVTVDDATPPQLYYTKCATMMSDAGTPADGGASDGGGAAPDAGGMPLCSGCTPPSYFGFQVNDGAGHEILVENHFYTSEHLQSSPECTTQMGAIAVTSGMTFSAMTGVLDYDPTGKVQTLAPVTDMDYATP